MTTAQPVAVRPATAADAPALLDIFTRSITELAPPFYAPPQVAAWAAGLNADRALALITDHTTYVAELVGDAAAGQVVGFATFAEPDEFDMIYVDPAVVMRAGWGRSHRGTPPPPPAAAGLPPTFQTTCAATRG